MADKANLQDLKELMAALRSETGCPWDCKQTPETLKTYIIEEAYELVEAVESGSPDEIRDELGDLLFQVIFQSQIFAERKQFNLDDVIDHIHKKMVLRHPHVFGDKQVSTSDEVKKQWVDIKKETKPKVSVLGEVPASLPALLRARRITDNAAQVGFDWERTEQVLEKVDEELGELKRAMATGKSEEEEHEFGDLLFAIVNLGRFLKINPEDALKKASARFEKRFHYIEAEAGKKGITLKNMTLAEMDVLWEEAKKKGM